MGRRRRDRNRISPHARRLFTMAHSAPSRRLHRRPLHAVAARSPGDPRAGRQIDLASRADAGRARGRPDRDHRPARRRGRACDGRGAECARGERDAGRRRPVDRRRRRRRRHSPSPKICSISAIPAPSARLLLGMLATHPFTTFVTGDASLRRPADGPRRRAAEPLSARASSPAKAAGCRWRSAAPATRCRSTTVCRCRRPRSNRRCCSPGSTRRARPP